MQVYRKEFERLNKVRSIVKTRFVNLGVNKKQEIARLLYEISKRESISPEVVIAGWARQSQKDKFGTIKQYLLKRRFPYSCITNEASRPYLPKIRLDLNSAFNLKKSHFYPKTIFVEKSAHGTYLTNSFRSFFPEATFKEIESLKTYLEKNRSLKIADYNNRFETIFITSQNYDLFKKCPCTKDAVRCGYHIFNLSFGCIYECTYCYLQEYTNTPGLIFPANIERFFRVFGSYKTPNMRIGTGEFSDSLMLDHITGYSLPLVEFFKRHKDTLFEFKTKSNNIDNLLRIKHSGNIVISWSLNPQKIIDQNEFFTSPLKERIFSAMRCLEAGYKLGFHFDPILYFNGWEREYRKVIEMLFDSIKPKDISWISIGTLRFNPKVKQVIETRFPQNKILDEELVPGFDNKLRYPYGIRFGIYRSMLKMLSKYCKNAIIYLCMEDRTMYQDLKECFQSA